MNSHQRSVIRAQAEAIEKEITTRVAEVTTACDERVVLAGARAMKAEKATASMRVELDVAIAETAEARKKMGEAQDIANEASCKLAGMKGEVEGLAKLRQRLQEKANEISELKTEVSSLKVQLAAERRQAEIGSRISAPNIQPVR